MLMKYASILIFTLFSFAAICQLKETEIVVPLKLETTNIPFNLSGKFTRLFDGDRNEFKGIPDFLNFKNSILKSITFKIDSVQSHTIYLIIGDKNENEKICIIDINNNHDFSDDYQYIYQDSLLTKESEFTVQSIPFEYFEKGEKIIGSIYLKPQFFPGNWKLGNEIEKKYFVLVFLSEYRTGNFFYNGEQYKVAVASRSFSSSGNDMVYSIKKEKEVFLSNTNDIDFYKPGEVIISGNNKFMIHKAALKKDTLSITYLGEQKAVETGFQTGLYAPHVITKTLGGEIFDLNDYKGKYVLFDFWGTWCGPCIKLIPDVKELQKKYKDLVIVSVACHEENEADVKKAIGNYNMNWIHLYDSFDNSPLLIDTFKVNSFPTTFVIDPKGEIVFRGGSQEFPALVELLEKKLSKL